MEAQTAATHSGTNLDNKVRQALVAFQKDQRAWHAIGPEAQVRIQNIINGGVPLNTMRSIANLLGGGGGMGGIVSAGIIGAIFGAKTGGTSFAIGKALKHLENRIVQNQARGLVSDVAGRSQFAPMVGPMTTSPFYQRLPRALIYGGLAGQ